MSPLPPERWPEAEKLLDRALDLPRDAREPWVREACGADDELRIAVLEWLAACEAPDLVPDTPAAVFGAPLLSADPPTLGAEPIEIGDRVGPFRIVRLLGRGGMGAVFLAERSDGQFEQRVAVKLMRWGAGDDERMRRRFLEERQILARLDHPHIATFIDGGLTKDGRPYFVMQHVEGVPIDRCCDQAGLSVEQRLELFVEVCDAVEYAHARQIVHRDLKPGNILVTSEGQAKLLDFGIAKLLDPAGDSAERGLTRTGERLLTPEFASPEQIRGEPVTPASDVYALGVLLHHLLSGRGPYGTGPRTPHEVERAVLDAAPVLPSDAVTADRMTGPRDAATSPEEISGKRGTKPDELRRRLRGDLDAIVVTALQKEPGLRYRTAGALAEEVRRHLRGLPVQARRRSRGYRLRALARRHRVTLGVAGAALVGAAAVFALGSLGRLGEPASPAPPPVLAIGRIVDYRENAADDAGAPLADMLATNLARTEGLGVVSSARMYELVGRPAGAENPDQDRYARAARLAGAAQLVEGAVYATGDGGLRLDLRRVDLASGAVAGALTSTGASLFAVADSATTGLVLGLGLEPPAGSIADVTTRSLAAYRLYTEGLERFSSGDRRSADRLFESALLEDSTFAMAAYYSAQMAAYNWRSPSATAVEKQIYDEREERAVRLADRASDRERLMMRSYFALERLAPDMEAVAETLAVRYPQEIFGHLAYAQSLGFQGRLLGSIPHFARVLEMDSASLGADVQNCFACEAMNNLTESYMLVDSLATAERLTRQWLERQPTSEAALRRLADVLDGEGRYAETAELLDSRAGPAPPDSALPLVKHWIRAGELDRADAELARWIESASVADRARYLYLRAVVLRNQGRLREALAVGRALRTATGEPARGAAAPPSALVEAQMLFELGRLGQAGALFDSIARWPAPGQPVSVRATQRVQAVSMVAATRYAAGDTALLGELADSLERDGERAVMFQPHDQHHYVRGLLFVARGDDDEAVAAFRRGLASTATDFGRTNRELALVLLRRGRPEEAARALDPAAHGYFLETTNLHVSLTEIHELLAEAWDAAGVPDSAAVHWARVARDWERADPELQPRRLRAAERAAADARSE